MDYEELLTEEEQKRLSKIAKCKHDKEFLIFVKCRKCSLVVSNKKNDKLFEKIAAILKNEEIY